MAIPEDVVAAWESAMGDPNAELAVFAPRVAGLIRDAATLDGFVAMPYGAADVESLYQDIVSPGMTSAGYRTVRSDETAIPGRIPDEMLGQIRQAFALVAVLSDTRGVNPNVMYEVGYAHAVGTPTILLASSADELPFDLRVDRTLTYDGRPPAETRELLTDSLRAIRGQRARCPQQSAVIARLPQAHR
jgi:hypothetical protein